MGNFLLAALLATGITEIAGFAIGASVHDCGIAAIQEDFLGLGVIALIGVIGIVVHFIAWDHARFWLFTARGDTHPIARRLPLVIALAIVTLAFGVLSGFAYEPDIAGQSLAIAALGWFAIIYKKK